MITNPNKALKNTIFRQLSLIVVILLVVTGVSYAYFNETSDVRDTISTNILTTEGIELAYNGTSLININNLNPGDSVTKTFTVTNNSEETVPSYRLFFGEVINELEIKSELTYSLTCAASSGVCSGSTSAEFPATSSQFLIAGEIASGVTHTYKLTITFANLATNQDYNQEKNIKFKILINSKLGKNDSTLTIIGGTIPALGFEDYIASIIDKEGTFNINPSPGYTILGNELIRCKTSTETFNTSLIDSQLVISNEMINSATSCELMLTRTFEYTGKAERFIVPESGRYILEVWGAQGGGNNSDNLGGKGGYSVASIYLDRNEILYVNVGQFGGSKCTDTNPFNGGGLGSQTLHCGGAGGGATDIRAIKNSLYSRLIVAGGGGGHASDTTSTGGFGGGETGGAGNAYSESYTGGLGGTLIAGGLGGTKTTFHVAGLPGEFGLGGNAQSGGGAYGAGGGGGGWFGGGAGANSGDSSAGGGGSGFIYTEANATKAKTVLNTNWLLDSNYYVEDFTNWNKETVSAATYSGLDTFTSPYGGTETGHSYNGFARISYLSVY